MFFAFSIIGPIGNSHPSQKIISKYYRTLFQNLKLTVLVPNIINSIIKIANNLQISENTKHEAIKFMTACPKCGIKVFRKVPILKN